MQEALDLCEFALFCANLRETEYKLNPTPGTILIRSPRTENERDMKTERPVYLSLTQFGWPFTAIASITHRVTGVLLFVGIAYLLWLLDMALESETGFATAGQLLSLPLAKLALIAVLGALFFHLFAGIKHMFMDFGIGETFAAATTNSMVTFVLTAIATLLAGVWLW
jgi:succinate dehydrogenase / fumarate reductase cytochrome b subunit